MSGATLGTEFEISSRVRNDRSSINWKGKKMDPQVLQWLDNKRISGLFAINYVSVKCLQCEKCGQVLFREFAREKRGRAGKS